MKRAFFCVIWATVFVFSSAVLLSMYAVASAGDDPVQQKLAARKAGQEYGIPAMAGSIVLAVVLSAGGVLPGTGKPSYEEESAVRPLVQPESRPMEPLQSRVGESVHVLHLGGFLSRHQQVLGGIPVFLLMGLFIIGTAKEPNVVLVGLAVGSIGFVPLLMLINRFVNYRWVQLDSNGVAWGGWFGSRQRTWEQIRSVSREELIWNRRYRTSTVRLNFEGGGHVTFDQAFTYYDALAGTIQAVASDLILPRKWEELHREGEARFGEVRLRADGIKMKGKYFTWEDLGSYKIENGHLVIYRRFRPKRGGDRGTPLSTIPDYPVLLKMMREGGAPL